MNLCDRWLPVVVFLLITPIFFLKKIKFVYLPLLILKPKSLSESKIK